MVAFEATSSIDMFAFCFVAIGPFLGEIKRIPHLTLKIQGQGHGQGQIRWSHSRLRVQSICLLFLLGNRNIFGRDIVNSTFDLEKKFNVKSDGHI